MQFKMPTTEPRARSAAAPTRSGEQMRTKSECGPARVVAPNSYYADLLMNAAFGRDSEMTAIHEYMYAAIMSDRPDVAAAFMEIMHDEEGHMKLEMELIRMLGREPKYRDAHGNWWSADYVYYGRSDCDRLSHARDGEIAAAAEYRRMAGMIADTNIQSILMCIAEDEDSHAMMFTDLMRKYCGYEMDC